MDKIDGVVLFSGGLDSSATLLKALEETERIKALFFIYGQNTFLEETEAIYRLTKRYGVEVETINLLGIKEFFQCPHTTGGKDVGEAGYSSYVPNRNLLFLTLLSNYCYIRDIPKIYSGFQHLFGKTGEAIKGSSIDTVVENAVKEINSQIYTRELHADQRPEFIDLAKQILPASSEKPIELITPLYDMDKVDIMLYLESKGELEFVLNNSYTCYNIREDGEKHEWGWGCGKCTACDTRKQSYEVYKNNYGGKNV